jgi:hypothetical protein
MAIINREHQTIKLADRSQAFALSIGEVIAARTTGATRAELSISRDPFVLLGTLSLADLMSCID